MQNVTIKIEEEEEEENDEKRDSHEMAARIACSSPVVLQCPMKLDRIPSEANLCL